MNVQDLILQQNVTISLTGEQLNDFANQILTGARSIYETKQVPEQYLTRRVTSEMLGVDQSTLWRWNKENYLCSMKIGGKTRYKLSDVKRILGEVAV